MSGTAPARPEPAGRYVKNANGVQFHYHQLGDDSAGTPAVFLHGGGPGCTAWTDFGPAADLFAADRPCLLVDLLQYGKTDKPVINGPMWDTHAKQYLSLLDAWGVERADLICNSWGGTGALRLAAAHPERVRKLVITGSMPVFYGPTAPLPERSARGRNARDRYYGGPDGPTWAKMRELMAALEWYDPERIPDITVTMRHEQSLTADERYIVDNPPHRGEWQDLSAELLQISAPTLYCWGMHDAFLTPDYPLMLASRMQHGHLYVMDRASHHLQEERPSDYHAAVTGFLNQEDPA